MPFTKPTTGTGPAGPGQPEVLNNNVTVNVNGADQSEILDRLEHVEDLLADMADRFNVLQEKVNMIFINTQALLDKVAEQITVDKSIEALLKTTVEQNKALADQLRDAIANNDPEALAAVQKALDDSVANLDANIKEVQKAITDNTPQGPPTPTERKAR